MAQHDYSIANQGFPATRADINNVLSAIATNNSGTSAPSTQYAGQFWIDTTSSTWTLYIHDGADDIQFATIDTSANTVNFTDSALDVVTDTTPQLGGDLDVNGNSIVSVSNGNISITPDGTGKVIIDGLSHPTADGTTGQFLKTDGSGNLSFDDAGGANTPYFYGELASLTTSLTRATYVKITGMTNNELDSDTAFDGTTFTVPSGQAGKYYLEGVMSASYGSAGQDGEQTIGSLYKNGSILKEGIFRTNSSYSHTRAVTTIASGIFNLSVGDTIELYAYTQDASGDNADVSAGGKTSLGGYKLVE